MVLVDSSIWIDHLHRPIPLLLNLLLDQAVLSHPLLVGEIAMGSLKDRSEFIGMLQRLPKALVARHEEALRMIERDRLHGLGIGYIDAHLLASVRLTPGATLWTRDKRLGGIAKALNLFYRPD